MYNYDPKIAARKAKNRQIFQETMEICRKGGYRTDAGWFALPSVQEVQAASVFYTQVPAVNDRPTLVEADRGEGPCVTQIDVVLDDCILVAKDLVDAGYRPVMLNMANAYTPGGGVLGGARAQEESLFRQSNLCVSLYSFDPDHAKLLDLPLGTGRYPMNAETGGIYSGCVKFFRQSAKEDDLLVGNPFTCAVVSVAAIDTPQLDLNGRLVPRAEELTKQKIRTILRIGLLHGHDAIVLSAFGCGAFNNPPDQMAELFQCVLQEREFANKYKVVRFAIIENHHSQNRNYNAFARVFNRPTPLDDAAANSCVQTTAGGVAANPCAQTTVDAAPANLCGKTATDFPKQLTAGMLAKFETTPRGSTRPRVGQIAGQSYIAKCGAWSPYSSDEHVENEAIADVFLRICGLRVPASRLYRVDFGTGIRSVRLAVYDATLTPLGDAWRLGNAALRQKIREQVRAAYPVQAFIAGIDTFTYDNVKVDAQGNLWFVDNGASFDFRARGKKKGWFWKRSFVWDTTTGYLSLIRHPDQALLQEILQGFTEKDLCDAARAVDFVQLAHNLPAQYRRPEIFAYAANLNAALH